MFKKIFVFVCVIGLVLSANPVLASSIDLGSRVSLNPSNATECALLWKAFGGDSIFGQNSPIAASNQHFIQVKPANQAYDSGFRIKANIEQNSSLTDLRAAVNVDTNMVFDGFYKPEERPKQIDLNLNSILDVSGIYFKLDRFAMSEVNTNGVTGNWYKQDFGFNSSQIEGIKEVGQIISEVLKTPKYQVYSQSTETKMQSMLCKIIESVNVSPAKDVTLGDGNYTQTRNVRVVDVVLKSNYEDILIQELPEVIDVLLKDSTFTSFLKNQYDRYVRLINALNKVYGSDSAPTILSKSVFDSGVDSLAGMYNKEEFGKVLAESRRQNLEYFTQTVEKTHFLVDSYSGELYGSVSQFKINWTETGINSMNFSPEAKSILKDGVVVSWETFNQKYGSSVNPISIPSNAASASEFNNRMNQNNPYVPAEVKKEDNEADITQKRIALLRPKFTSCQGNVGKKIDQNGKVVKRVPRGSNIITADTTGLVLAGAKDVISCVKSAAKFPSMTCAGNLDRRLNYKGEPAGRPSENGRVIYMSDDFGKIFTNKFNTVICTRDSNLLGVR